MFVFPYGGKAGFECAKINKINKNETNIRIHQQSKTVFTVAKRLVLQPNKHKTYLC